ncbi:MAG: hypothetical protein Q8P41_10400 [Pseudomonadota bacterium]|nr:hypothetical protein [Pseudomonadota bacterium]
MTTLVLLLGLAHAAPPPPPSGPWPVGAPLRLSFTWEPLFGVVAPDTGEAAFAPGREEAYTWMCEAKPAARSGRQLMACVEEGLGTVWIVWGPERQIRSLDIDDAPGEHPLKLLEDRRASVFAGALELWPAGASVGAQWTQGSVHEGVRVAHTVLPTAFAVTHAVTAVEAGRITMTSTGTGPLAGATASEVKVEGEAVFDVATALLVERWVLVQPARTQAGMFGVMGHRVTVKPVAP